MATARMTLGNVFGSISTAAETVTTTLNAASAGVGMLTAFVDKAAQDQKDRYALDSKTSREQLLIEKSQEIADMKVGVLTYCAKSKDHAQAFTEAYADLKTVFDAK